MHCETFCETFLFHVKHFSVKQFVKHFFVSRLRARYFQKISSPIRNGYRTSLQTTIESLMKARAV